MTPRAAAVKAGRRSARASNDSRQAMPWRPRARRHRGGVGRLAEARNTPVV